MTLMTWGDVLLGGLGGGICLAGVWYMLYWLDKRDQRKGKWEG